MEKKKTFKELFAGTGIEPTTDENGGVHYEFNATLKKPVLKLYTEEQVKKAMIKSLGYSDDVIGFYPDVEILNQLTPIELPSDEEIDKQGFQVPYDGTNEFYDKSFIKGAKWMKEQILNQNK